MGISFGAGSRWLLGEHLFWPVARWQALQREELERHVAHSAMTQLYAGRVSAGAALRDLPITTKDALAAVGDGAFGCERSAVREWVTTSGTLGKPLSVPLTAGDLDRIAASEHGALSLAGLGRGDVLLLLVGMDRLFVAGLAYWLGAQSIGATTVRAGPQHAASGRLLAETIERYGVTHLIAVPSFLAVHAAQETKAHSTLKAIIGIGEPVQSSTDLGQPNMLGARLRAAFGVPVLATYASTEACTAFASGPLCHGGHLNPQMAMIEILDEQGRALADGETGEVTITPLGIEGLPLLRFRTGDIAALHTQPCPCGRTTPRLGPILGRKQQMMKVKGATVYPGSIPEALAGIPEVVDSVAIVERDHDLADVLTLHVALREDGLAIRARMEATLRATLKVLPRVVYASEAALRELQLARDGRKAQRFIDRR